LAALAGGMLCISTAAAQTGTTAPAVSPSATQGIQNPGQAPSLEGKGDLSVRPSDIPEGGNSNNECNTAEVIACPASVTVNLAVATTNASDPAYSCHVAGAQQGFGSVWYRFTATTNEVRLRTCDSVAQDSLIAVYTGNCSALPGSLVEICCTDDNCGPSTFLGDLCCNNLIIGQTYFVQLAAWSAGDQGSYTLQLDCECAPPCDVVCDPDKIVEGEDAFNCGVPDTFNGGCNDTVAFPFFPLACGDELCGTYTAPGGTRDTDWFTLGPIANPTSVTWSLTGEAPTLGFIILPGPNPLDPCTGLVILISGTANPCETVTINALVPAGPDAWVWAGPSVFAGVPDCVEYNAVLECEGGTPCDVICDPDKIVEGEDAFNCGVPDTFNGGCNDTIAFLFFPLACGDELCGTYTAPGGTRDTDWFTVGAITQPTSVTWSLIGEAPTLGFIILPGPNPLDPCTGLAIVTSGTANPCDPIVLNAIINPTPDLWVWAGPSVFAGVPGCVEYNAALDCMVEEPCDVVCDPDKVDEGEPDCFDGYVDNFNGGCNSTPPVFSPVNCGDEVCGTGGTFIGAGGGNFRDTDWYEVVHDGSSDLTVCVTAEFSVAIFILDSNCPPAVLASGTGGPCVPTCVTLAGAAAGTYHIFVGASVFTGVPCGAEYNASFECAGAGCPCDCEPGDLDNDCDVDTTDLNFVLSGIGCTGGGCGIGDVVGDGDIDTTDLNFVLSQIGCGTPGGPCP
jgi:hypothetical protein